MTRVKAAARKRCEDCTSFRAPEVFERNRDGSFSGWCMLHDCEGGAIGESPRDCWSEGVCKAWHAKS